MNHWLERSELLIGKEKLDQLAKAHVMIVGLGGIGSFAGEFIARAGIGTMTIIDGDVFDPTNKFYHWEKQSRHFRRAHQGHQPRCQLKHH